MIILEGGKKILKYKLLFIDNLTLQLAVNRWDWITESMNSRITKTWIKQFLKYKFTNSMDNYHDFVCLMRFDIFSQRTLSMLNAFLKISTSGSHMALEWHRDLQILAYVYFFCVWTVPLPSNVNQPWNVKMRLPFLSTVHKMNRWAILAIKYENNIIQND